MPSTKNNRKEKEPKFNSRKMKEKHDFNMNDVPKVIFRITPDLYPDRVTRGTIKMLNHTVRDFIIVEVYRCMPLLGDEEKIAPDWTEHIVRYDIVFIDKK